jgi:hypothetical protein
LIEGEADRLAAEGCIVAGLLYFENGFKST